MNRPKVSVIVPVYNVSNYISKCVTSLFTQTIVDDIEFIFIDDNSSDDSLAKILSLSERYGIASDRLNIVRLQNNHGSSYARYLGFKNATGKYIGFCDGDDWIELDMFEKLYISAELNNSDIVCCNYFKNEGDSELSLIYEPPMDTIGAMIANEFPTCLWAKFFSSSIFQPISRIKMPPGDMGEDFSYCIQAFLYASRVSYVSQPLYHYRISPNSMSNACQRSKILKRFNDLKANTDQVIEILKEKQLLEKYREEILYRKILVKIMLSLVMNDRDIKLLFKTTYPEINSHILVMRIPWDLKKAYFLAASGIKAALRYKV